MPLYEFQCKSCGEILEKLMKVSDPNPVKCEICEKGPLVKLMSRTHFVLKGQGWYETDFKNSRHVSTSTQNSAQDSSENSSTPKKPDSSEKSSPDTKADTPKKSSKPE